MPKKLLNVEKNIKNDNVVVKTTQKEQDDVNIVIETSPTEEENEKKQMETVEKRPRGRPSGSLKLFKKEKEYVILKMNSILGITKDYESIVVEELNDVNGEKYHQIIDMIPDIKKYFKCGSWRYFTSHSEKPSLLVKNLYYAYGYEVKQSRETVSTDVTHYLKIKKI